MIEKMIKKNEKRYQNDEKKTFTKIRKKEKKQKSNVNRNVVVRNLTIHLIVQEIVHHNIVLYQNQQSLLFENLSRFIKILMICDNFKIKNRIKNLSKKNLADLNKK